MIGSLDFIVLIKSSNVWPSADVKHMYDLVLIMPWQFMLSLSIDISVL
jgi:hypothetical protein